MNTPNQWQLSGNAAERYERVLVPAIFSPWAADLVALAKLRPGERVLDVACGTGVVGRLAAERVGPKGHVTGLDLNESMLEVARSQPIPAGAAGVAGQQPGPPLLPRPVRAQGVAGQSPRARGARPDGDVPQRAGGGVAPGVAAAERDYGPTTAVAQRSKSISSRASCCTFSRVTAITCSA